MNNEYKRICLLFSLFLMSCSNQQSQKDLQMIGDYFTIDLDGEKETSIPFSSYFKSVRTIILETGDDCLIGKIDELQVFDDYIFILDSNKAKGLFIFDKEGKFIRKIGNIGRGPGEYVELLDFTYDVKNCIVYLLVEANKVHKYQLDGTYLNTLAIQGEGFFIKFIQYYNDKLYSTSIGWRSGKNDYLLYEIEPNEGKILSQALSIKYNKGWNETYFFEHGKFFMAPTNNPPRYNQVFMDYIVSIGENITPYIKLKSKYLTTEKDIEDFRGKDGMRINSINIAKSSKIFGVHCFFENENYVYFRLAGGAMFAVIFDKKTKEVKLANRLNNDLIFNKNPIIFIGQFTFSDSNGAYEIWDTQTSALSGFQRSLNNNDVVPDLDKLDELMKLEEDANPVIFFYEFK